jgi:hypothetical protein
MHLRLQDSRRICCIASKAGVFFPDRVRIPREDHALIVDPTWRHVSRWQERCRQTQRHLILRPRLPPHIPILPHIFRSRSSAYQCVGSPSHRLFLLGVSTSSGRSRHARSKFVAPERATVHLPRPAYYAVRPSPSATLVRQ